MYNFMKGFCACFCWPALVEQARCDSEMWQAIATLRQSHFESCETFAVMCQSRAVADSSLPPLNVQDQAARPGLTSKACTIASNVQVSRVSELPDAPTGEWHDIACIECCYRLEAAFNIAHMHAQHAQHAQVSRK